MTAVEERICDRNLLKLLRAMLRAGVLSDGVAHHAVTGTPQGGVISPLLANVYLHRLDREWNSGRDGVLVRYADDLVAICHTRRQAERALRMLQERLAELGLQTKAAKTRIVHLQEAGEGLDFLGFHLRMVRARSPRHRHVVFLARWPSRKAMQHARDRVRFLTARARQAAPVPSGSAPGLGRVAWPCVRASVRGTRRGGDEASVLAPCAGGSRGSPAPRLLPAGARCGSWPLWSATPARPAVPATCAGHARPAAGYDRSPPDRRRSGPAPRRGRCSIPGRAGAGRRWRAAGSSPHPEECRSPRDGPHRR